MSRTHRQWMSSLAAVLLASFAAAGHAQETDQAATPSSYSDRGSDPVGHTQVGAPSTHRSIFGHYPANAAAAEQRNRDIVRSVTGLPGGSNGSEGR
ncbi:hypothetical protein [Paraburkholderia sp.]|uniref:hypothetical protein n=1 Tax=Paraburkholderia sp. TaxID=1926495 RepID=UPI003D6ECD9B